MVAPVWRCNLGIGPPRTSIFSLPRALTRRHCAHVWVHRTQDNLEAFVNRGGLVKVAFFGGLDNLQRVEDPSRAAGSVSNGRVSGRHSRYENASNSSSR